MPKIKPVAIVLCAPPRSFCRIVLSLLDHAKSSFCHKRYYSSNLRFQLVGDLKPVLENRRRHPAPVLKFDLRSLKLDSQNLHLNKRSKIPSETE